MAKSLRRPAMVRLSNFLVLSMRFAAPWKFSVAMADRNKDIPDDRRIEFRIGINVGDIIIDEGDIFGDGVNIAARVENFTSPGEIGPLRQRV